MANCLYLHDSYTTKFDLMNYAFSKLVVAWLYVGTYIQIMDIFFLVFLLVFVVITVEFRFSIQWHSKSHTSKGDYCIKQ